MADDRMKNDDINRQAGNKGDKDFDRQSPGRNPQDDQSTRQRGGQDFDDEDVDEGQSGGQGGKGSMGQRR